MRQVNPLIITSLKQEGACGTAQEKLGQAMMKALNPTHDCESSELRTDNQ